MTYEEVTKKYPIGMTMNCHERRWVTENFKSKRELDDYLAKYSYIELVDNHTVRCLSKRRPQIRVEGYIFNGYNDEWYPAYNYDLDEWGIINEDDEDDV